MPINIYTVTNHLEAEGWKLISDSYKNLNTELEMICPNGHIQKQTYAQWRRRIACEQCLAGDPYKIKRNKIPIKTPNTTRILGLDAATNITGYSVYDDGILVNYGTYKAKGEKTKERINDVKKWLEAILKNWEIDFVGLENVQLQYFGTKATQAQVKTFQTLTQLQGVLLDVLFEACVDSDLVYASEWRSFCGINYGDRSRENKKKMAQEKVKLWYNQDCTQDEADAICIGKYFTSKIKNSTSTWGESID